MGDQNTREKQPVATPTDETASVASPIPTKRPVPKGLIPFKPGHAPLARPPVRPTERFCGVKTARLMGIDPIALMLSIIRDGHITEMDGIKTTVSLDERMRLLREVAPYVVSKAPTKVESRVDHTHLDITRVMLDPAVADLADQLAEAMADRTRQLPAGSPPDEVLEADFEHITDDNNH